jgi:hypothetical protein
MADAIRRPVRGVNFWKSNMIKTLMTLLFLLCMSLSGCDDVNVSVLGDWYDGHWAVDMEKTAAYNKEAATGFQEVVIGGIQRLAYLDSDEVMEITAEKIIISEPDGDVEVKECTITNESAKELTVKVGIETRTYVRDGKWMYLQQAGKTRIYFKKTSSHKPAK